MSWTRLIGLYEMAIKYFFGKMLSVEISKIIWNLSHSSLLNLDLNNRVYKFIVNNCWYFPTVWLDLFPFLEGGISTITLSDGICKDKLIWKAYDSGMLTLKDTYRFKNHFNLSLPGLSTHGVSRFHHSNPS